MRDLLLGIGKPTWRDGLVGLITLVLAAVPTVMWLQGAPKLHYYGLSAIGTAFTLGAILERWAVRHRTAEKKS